jgi:protein phosphatase methylesterase 1
VEVEDPATKLKKYVWRTDLLATKQYWEGWFKGLTECFLNVRCKKQLLLAAADRMDMELTKAHMMGKYKMVVIDNCGHVIQEDQPAKVADSFVDFMTTFRIPEKFEQKIYITSVSGKQVLIGV